MGSPPSATARIAPTGCMLEDGFSSVITFEADPDVALWEKTVTPAGYDGGDPIDITTMHNQTFMTKSHQSLFESTDISATVAYTPILFDQIRSLINVDTVVTITFPDGGTWAAYGFLRSFTPDALSRGSQPEATIVIVITNRDPSDCSEQAPVVVEGTGTGSP